jgi:kinesin family protein 2/24
MGGDLSSVKTDYSHGIYAQTARDIFQRLSLPQYRSSVEIYVTFYEIYCGKVFDLLNNKKRLRVLEDQKGLVQVCDRKEQQVKSVQDVLNIIQRKTTIFFLHYNIFGVIYEALSSMKNILCRIQTISALMILLK